MNKDFDSLISLMEEVGRDRCAQGANSSMLNRYPVRFVLFDNFADSKEFIGELIESGVTKMQKIVDWMDKEHPDVMLTCSELAKLIEQYIADNAESSCVIVPFSELARFYDNKEAKEFDALIGAIKGVQTSLSAFNCRQRIYIPLIGQYGKMSKFFMDSQCVIWHLAGSEDVDKGYRMILSQSTYGVKGLEDGFTIVPSVTDWLKVWRDEKVKPDIISTSRSVFAFSENARPDNALTYVTCNNAYEFLTKGLNLNLGEVIYRAEDAQNWERLATEINYKQFSFERFFNEYFDIFDLSGPDVFVKAWFENTDMFRRWLLGTYYVKKFCNSGYICRLLSECRSYVTSDFVSAATLQIFKMEHPEEYIEERAVILGYARKAKIPLPEQTEDILCRMLENISVEQGYETALRYMTGHTYAEKKLLIVWLAGKHIALGRLAGLYPELYSLLDGSYQPKEAGKKWVAEYISAYKWAKLSNIYSDDVKHLISERNKDAVSFFSWYNSFSTVRTLLAGRTDIDVFCWIDGLGIDWIDYILKTVEEYEHGNVYVDEVMIARALLPTTTDFNKAELMKLSNVELSKKGDLDGFAHKCTQYPLYIIKELEIVKKAIREIICEYAGKKIAVVSDHGLSYLSQLCDGYNIGGIKSDHYGRCAMRQSGAMTNDDKYYVLDDNITLCALRHNSLCAKVPDGQGCHGGCVPEEVLVPIIVISSGQRGSEYSISLPDNEISGMNPVLRFIIKGITDLDTPKLLYNDVEYSLRSAAKDSYVSERLSLVRGVEEVEVRIGSYQESFRIKINLGASEDDLFDM